MTLTFNMRLSRKKFTWMKLLHWKEREEYSFAIIDNDNNDLNSTLINENDVNQSYNRSGLTCITRQTCEVSVQTDPVIISKPNLHIKECVCTEDIKTTSANLSSSCGLSIEN